MIEAAFEPAGEWLQPARPLTPAVFRGFTALIYREAGIHLSDAKQSLLVGRRGIVLHALQVLGRRSSTRKRPSSRP
jgi:hypothetical protein